MQKRSSSGFSLIEVLVAVAILSFGLLAVAALQGRVLRNTADADARTGATAIAQGIVDRMRESLVITTSAESILEVDGRDRVTYEELATGDLSDLSILGGDGSATTITRGNVIYTPAWAVQDYYRNAAGDGFQETALSGSTALPQFKRVTVTVAWDDAQGTGRSVILEEIIPRVAPGDSGLLLEDEELGGGQPKVSYTPQPAPEVVKIPTLGLGGGRFRETTEPAPDILRNEFSTLTTFSTVTFDEDGSDFIAARREDFVIVNCRCVLEAATTDNSREPFVWNGLDYAEALIYDGNGDVVTPSKLTGSVSSTFRNQPKLCTDCCASHHDSSQSVQSYDPFRLNTDRNHNSAGDHNHYLREVDADNNQIFTIADLSGTNQEYDEACRFVRVDGFFELAQDFQMVSYNTMPQSQLEDSNKLATYQAYITDTVTRYMGQLASDCGQTVANNCYPGLLPDTSMSPFSSTAIDVTPEAVMVTLKDNATRTPNANTQPTLNQDDDNNDGFLSDSELSGFRSEYGFKPWMARALYIDYINNYVPNPGLTGSIGLRDCIERRKLDPDVDTIPDDTPSHCHPEAGSELDIIPFFEVNVTGLAAWTMLDTDQNAYLILNQPIEDDSEREYLRGDVRLFTETGDTVRVYSQNEASNSGLTDTASPDPADDTDIFEATATIEAVAVPATQDVTVLVNLAIANNVAETTYPGILADAWGLFRVNPGDQTRNRIADATEIDCSLKQDESTLKCTFDASYLLNDDVALGFDVGGYVVDQNGDGNFQDTFVCTSQPRNQDLETGQEKIDIIRTELFNSGTTSEFLRVFVGGADNSGSGLTFPQCDSADADSNPSIPDCTGDLTYVINASVKRSGSC